MSICPPQISMQTVKERGYVILFNKACSSRMQTFNMRELTFRSCLREGFLPFFAHSSAFGPCFQCCEVRRLLQSSAVCKPSWVAERFTTSRTMCASTQAVRTFSSVFLAEMPQSLAGTETQGRRHRRTDGLTDGRHTQTHKKTNTHRDKDTHTHTRTHAQTEMCCGSGTSVC